MTVLNADRYVAQCKLDQLRQRLSDFDRVAQQLAHQRREEEYNWMQRVIDGLSAAIDAEPERIWCFEALKEPLAELTPVERRWLCERLDLPARLAEVTPHDLLLAIPWGDRQKFQRAVSILRPPQQR
jgi:hypothetical protein